MAEIIDFELASLMRDLHSITLVEQRNALRQGYVLIMIFRKIGRRQGLALLRQSYEALPDDDLTKALGWLYRLRQKARALRLARAANCIPGVRELVGHSIITHWFQTLSLREIPQLRDPVAVFGVPVAQLEAKGLPYFQQQLARWRAQKPRAAKSTT